MDHAYATFNDAVATGQVEKGCGKSKTCCSHIIVLSNNSSKLPSNKQTQTKQFVHGNTSHRLLKFTILAFKKS
jgi:hypothetical protein